MQSSENLLNFSATQTQQLSRFGYYFALCGREHIFYEYAVSLRWICYEHVRNRADKLAVLNDWRATQECGQERTTLFNGKFIKNTPRQIVSPRRITSK